MILSCYITPRITGSGSVGKGPRGTTAGVDAFVGWSFYIGGRLYKPSTNKTFQPLSLLSACILYK
jgi:hypothetical protein